MIKKNEKTIFRIACILMCAFLMILLLYFAIQKSGYHMDELLTYGLSNSDFKPFIFDRYNEWVPSTYYSDYLTVTESRRFSFDSVIYNQTNDVHPPLYYILFHFVSSLVPNTFSKWIGIGINIVFYYLTLLMIYKIMTHLTKNKWLGLISAGFWSVSVGAITSVMYIRMYAIFAFFLTFLLYLVIVLYTNNKSNYKIYLSIYIVSLLGIMTQYYFLIGAFFISAVIFLLLMIRKSWNQLIRFSLSMFGSILSAVVLFPPIIDHILFSNRGKQAVDNLSSDSASLNSYLEIINEFIFGKEMIVIISVLIISAIVRLFVVYFRKANEVNSNNHMSFYSSRLMLEILLLFLIPSILYTVVISKIAPYDSVRYILPIFPVISTGLIYIVYLIFNNQRFKNLGISAVLLFVIVISYRGLSNSNVGYLYQDYENTSEIVKEFDDHYALFIEDHPRRVSGNLLELITYKKVYPLVISEENDALPIDQVFYEEEELVIYIHNSFEQSLVIDNINETYDFGNHTELFVHNGLTAYLFTR